MRLRWWLVIAGVAIVGAMAIGYARAPERNGSVFRGLTTSEWHSEIANWEISYPPCGTGGHCLWVTPRAKWWSTLSEHLGVCWVRRSPELPLLAGDPEALPVLMELMADS